MPAMSTRAKKNEGSRCNTQKNKKKADSTRADLITRTRNVGVGTAVGANVTREQRGPAACPRDQKKQQK